MAIGFMFMIFLKGNYLVQFIPTSSIDEIWWSIDE